VASSKRLVINERALRWEGGEGKIRNAACNVSYSIAPDPTGMFVFASDAKVE
jgi:hypothetical protein